jgi:hypothetical protein
LIRGKKIPQFPFRRGEKRAWLPKNLPRPPLIKGERRRLESGDIPLFGNGSGF